jgi:hypothetical protein
MLLSKPASAGTRSIGTATKPANAGTRGKFDVAR